MPPPVLPPAVPVQHAQSSLVPRLKPSPVLKPRLKPKLKLSPRLQHSRKPSPSPPLSQLQPLGYWRLPRVLLPRVLLPCLLRRYSLNLARSQHPNQRCNQRCNLPQTCPTHWCSRRLLTR